MCKINTQFEKHGATISTTNIGQTSNKHYVMATLIQV